MSMIDLEDLDQDLIRRVIGLGEEAAKLYYQLVSSISQGKTVTTEIIAERGLMWIYLKLRDQVLFILVLK